MENVNAWLALRPNNSEGAPSLGGLHRQGKNYKPLTQTNSGNVGGSKLKNDGWTRGGNPNVQGTNSRAGPSKNSRGQSFRQGTKTVANTGHPILEAKNSNFNSSSKAYKKQEEFDNNKSGNVDISLNVSSWNDLVVKSNKLNAPIYGNLHRQGKNFRPNRDNVNNSYQNKPPTNQSNSTHSRLPPIQSNSTPLNQNLLIQSIPIQSRQTPAINSGHHSDGRSISPVSCSESNRHSGRPLPQPEIYEPSLTHYSDKKASEKPNEHNYDAEMFEQPANRRNENNLYEQPTSQWDERIPYNQQHSRWEERNSYNQPINQWEERDYHYQPINQFREQVSYNQPPTQRNGRDRFEEHYDNMRPTSNWSTPSPGPESSRRDHQDIYDYEDHSRNFRESGNNQNFKYDSRWSSSEQNYYQRDPSDYALDESSSNYNQCNQPNEPYSDRSQPKPSEAELEEFMRSLSLGDLPNSKPEHYPGLAKVIKLIEQKPHPTIQMDRGRFLLEVDIELPNGQCQTLNLHLNDDPFELAKLFSQKYSLPGGTRIIKKLAERLKLAQKQANS